MVDEFKKLIQLFDNIKKESRSTKKIKLLKDFPYPDYLKSFLAYAYDSKYVFNVTSKTFAKLKGGVMPMLPDDFFHKVLEIKNHGERVKYIERQLGWMFPAGRKYVLAVFDKDLGIGINTKTINAAFPNLISEFGVMLAFKQTEEKFRQVYPSDDGDCYYNIKIDGVRCVIDVRDKDNIVFYSRNGKEMEEFLIDNIRAEIARNIKVFQGHKLDCEIASNQFQKFMKIYRRKNFVNMDSILIKNSVRLYIFDLIDMADEPLYKRVNALFHMSTYGEFRFIKFLSYKTEKSNYIKLGELAREYIRKGEEGIIVKKIDAPYEFKRSNYWLKFKNKDTIDVKITGYYAGEAGTKYENTLGGLILDYNGSELRCGSGFTDEERDEIWKIRNDLNGMMCEISYMEETKTGSLRHPVFERFRFDLDE